MEHFSLYKDINYGGFSVDSDLLIKLFCCKNIIKNSEFNVDNFYHFGINNKVINDFVFDDSQKKSCWASPLSDLANGFFVIDKLDMTSNIIPKEKLLLHITNLQKTSAFFITNQSLVAYLSNINHNGFVLIDIDVNSKGESKHLECLLCLVEEYKKQFKFENYTICFDDIDSQVTFSISEKKKDDLAESAKKYYSGVEMLKSYTNILINEPVVTSGLEEINNTVLQMFDTLYNSQDFDLTEEKKAFFRSLQKPTGKLIYTQRIETFLYKKFRMLCKKNNIQYWAYAGTMLGAFRHQGFIPWDDDVDVAMMQDDLETLIEKLKDNPYFTIDIYYNTNWADKIYKFRFKDSSYFGFIDIFTFYYCKENTDEMWTTWKKLKSSMIHNFRALQDKIGKKYASTYYIPEEDKTLFENLYKEYKKNSWRVLNLSKEKTRYIIWNIENAFADDFKQIFDCEESFPLKLMPFENSEILCLKNGEEILKMHYKNPYSLPKDIITHRHTARMNEETFDYNLKNMQKLENYNFDANTNIVTTD